MLHISEWFHVYLQLGQKFVGAKKPVNPLVFLFRFILGNIAASWFVLVPIYMMIKDKLVSKGKPI